MKKTLNAQLWAAALIILSIQCSTEAATVITKFGPREGRAIVRESMDRLVVTIVLAKEKRLFQFYARDVERVTAATKILIGEKTLLRKEPADEAESSIDLCRGLEVEIAQGQTNTEWVKVRGWGNTEGWIRRKVLTDEVIFTPEDKQIPSQTPSEPVPPSGDKVQSATPAVRQESSESKS